MSLLKQPPSVSHLSRLYWELAKHGAECVGEKKRWSYNPRSAEELFALAAEMSRYDPRLMTILTLFLIKAWMTLNPSLIRRCYAEMMTPETVAVVAEFVRRFTVDSELQYFCDYLQKGLKGVSLQFYFHHLYVPGGDLAARVINAPLAEYKKWGFLAREAPILDQKRKQVFGTLDTSARRNILRRLFERKKSITISEYLHACDNTLSRQQALIDLQEFEEVKLEGRGRGARWTLLERETS